MTAPDIPASPEETVGPRFVPGRFEWVALDDLEPHPRNSNEGDLGALLEGVETVGFYGLLYVQEPARSPTGKHQLIAGEHRWRALREKGATRAPCWVLDVDDDTAFRILVRDNHTTRLGRDRPDILVENLRELTGTPLGLAGTSFDGDDLAMLLRDLEEPLAPLPPEPAPEQPGPAMATCPACGHQFLAG